MIALLLMAAALAGAPQRGLDNCVPRYSWMLAAALPLLSCKLVRGESPDGA